MEGPLLILDRLHRGDVPRMVAMTTVQGGRLIFTRKADVDAYIEAYRRGDNAASFTVHEVPRIDLHTFWQNCRDHDWHYANSDDQRAYREGGAVASRLEVQATISREHRRIYYGWLRHHETGPAYGTERRPAPEKPARATDEAGGA